MPPDITDRREDEVILSVDNELSLEEFDDEEEDDDEDDDDDDDENAMCMMDCISSYVLNNAVPITVDLVKPGIEYKIFLGKVTIFFFHLLNLELEEEEEEEEEE